MKRTDSQLGWYRRVSMGGRLNRGTGAELTAVLFAVVTACGGLSQRHDDGGSGGATGGSGTTGGSSATGGSGATGGSSATGGSGATGGSSATGGSGMAGGCTYKGIFYRVTATFPAGDGCNMCICRNDGSVACNPTGCVGCEDLFERFENAMLDAKRCNPQLRDVPQCTRSTPSGLTCACPTYVNDDTELWRLAREYQDAACPCRPGCEPLVAGRCSEDSVCVDEYATP